MRNILIQNAIDCTDYRDVYTQFAYTYDLPAFATEDFIEGKNKHLIFDYANTVVVWIASQINVKRK